ncbi:MAG: hypothetical protein IPJ69_12270 [Deltaproteobacteria bacterium]|nr:MAG: hypothetical protein IPJ69_12270 [Deltaproteobacteria bacterium]
MGSSSSTNPAGLLLGSDAPALTLDTTVAVPCDSGSATIVVNPGTPTAITYDHCRFGDYTIDGLATITTTSLHHTTITYTNVTYSTTSCGAYGLNGTIGIDSSAASTTTFLPVTVTYGLSTQRGGSVGTITGTVTHNTGDTLSGNMNVTNPNFTCNYSNTALTCPALTSACSLSSASLCNGNDFRTDICSL